MRSIGWTPQMSFTVTLIQPGRLRRAHHREAGDAWCQHMYVNQRSGLFYKFHFRSSSEYAPMYSPIDLAIP